MQVQHQQVLPNQWKSKGEFVSLHLFHVHSHKCRWNMNDSYSRTLTPPPHLQVQGGLSPATSEMNLYNRSTSPIGIPMPNLTNPRPRLSAYDTLLKRRTELNTTVRPLIQYILYTDNTYYHPVHTISCFSLFIYISFIATGGAHPLQHALCHSGGPQ